MGAIAGGVVGGVLGISVLAGLTVLLHRNHLKKKTIIDVETPRPLPYLPPSPEISEQPFMKSTLEGSTASATPFETRALYNTVPEVSGTGSSKTSYPATRGSKTRPTLHTTSGTTPLSSTDSDPSKLHSTARSGGTTTLRAPSPTGTELPPAYDQLEPRFVPQEIPAQNPNQYLVG
jgi:hypothetical protein